jgi:hypothetical protein
MKITFPQVLRFLWADRIGPPALALGVKWLSNLSPAKREKTKRNFFKSELFRLFRVSNDNNFSKVFFYLKLPPYTHTRFGLTTHSSNPIGPKNIFKTNFCSNISPKCIFFNFKKRKFLKSTPGSTYLQKSGGIRFGHDFTNGAFCSETGYWPGWPDAFMKKSPNM